MRVLIVGGTGFIGRKLCEHLVQHDHHVIIASRSMNDRPKRDLPQAVEVVKWPLNADRTYSVDAVINLAGETINQRWTNAAKKRIYTSRIHTVQQIRTNISQGMIPTRTLLNASAVGYYGTSETETFTEQSPAGHDFLAHVVNDWEKEVQAVQSFGVREVRLRFGVVLGNDGGALGKMMLPYRLFVGGKIGSGKQWVPWIHVDDVLGLIVHALENDTLEGALNVTAPHPVRNDQFGRAISRALRRPHWLPLPAFVLRTALGEMSDLLLRGQRVLPEKALAHHYRFTRESVEDALTDLVY